MRVRFLLPILALFVGAFLWAQTKTPYEPLSSAQQYASYGTCAEAQRATGLSCTWTASRQPKSWVDATAKPMFTGPGGVEYSMYERVFMGKFDSQQNGVIEQLVIPVEEARTFNIPPKGDGMTNVPGADQPEVPAPLKILGENQRIQRYGPIAVPMVRNLDVPIVAPDPQQAEILMLLRAIAAKLGVD